MKFNFRMAKKEDKNEILSLVKKLAAYERKKPEEIGLTLDKIEHHGFGKESYFHILLAEHNQIPIAYVLYFFSYSASAGAPILYVEDFFVEEEYRLYGLGTELLCKLAKLAVEKECCRVEWHVFTWNTKAAEFYERIGATPKRDLLQFRLQGEQLESLAAKKIDNET